MNSLQIRNDDDHRAALAEIDRLWDAAEGTVDDDKLNRLVTLVEQYEETRWPVEINDAEGRPDSPKPSGN